MWSYWFSKIPSKVFLLTFQICLMWMLVLSALVLSKYFLTIRELWQSSPSFSMPLRARIGDDEVNMFRWNERMNSFRSCSVLSLLTFEWLPELTQNPMGLLIWFWMTLTFIVHNFKRIYRERHAKIEDFTELSAVNEKKTSFITQFSSIYSCAWYSFVLICLLLFFVYSFLHSFVLCLYTLH